MTALQLGHLGGVFVSLRGQKEGGFPWSSYKLPQAWGRISVDRGHFPLCIRSSCKVEVRMSRKILLK